jgi:hypothetical protein
MKRTLICIHVMPPEFTLFERWIADFRQSLSFLTPLDRVTLRASLNLNPRRIDWSQSSLSPAYFIERFRHLMAGLPANYEIREDDSLAGTTQQKRECIALDYDQFIFADPDIAFPPYLLKGLLGVSYKLSGRYMVAPPVPRLWDETWDMLVHPDLLTKPLGYYLSHSPEETRRQPPQEIFAVPIEETKFGTGWMNLYSKELLSFTGIPESLGGYGAEDTFIGLASRVARHNGYPCAMYILRNVYVSEDYVTRRYTLDGQVAYRDTRMEQREAAEKHLAPELSIFAKRSLGMDLAFTFTYDPPEANE